MAHLPIIIVSGEAGSGKDAISSIIAKAYNGVTVAQADPMKRFVKEVFKFDDNSLWGSSETRAKPINTDEYTTREGWAMALGRLKFASVFFFKDMFPQADDDFIRLADIRLEKWFFDLRAHFAVGPNSGHPSSRYILQTLGTEWGRSMKPTMWSSFAIESCLKLLAGEFDYTREKGLILNKDQQGYGCAIISDGRFKDEILAVRRIGGTTIKVISSEKVELAGGIKNHPSEVQQRTIPDHFYDLIVMNDKSKGLDKLAEQLNLVLGKLPALAAPLIIKGW